MVQMPRKENFVSVIIFVDSCGKKISCGSSVIADVIHLDSVMNKFPLSIPSCLPRSHGEKTQIKSSHLIALTPPPGSLHPPRINGILPPLASPGQVSGFVIMVTNSWDSSLQRISRGTRAFTHSNYRSGTRAVPP